MKAEKQQHIHHNSIKSILKREVFNVWIDGVRNPFELRINKDTLEVKHMWREYERKQDKYVLEYFNGKKMQSRFRRTKNAMNG